MKDEEYSLLAKRIRDLLKMDLDSYKEDQMRRRLDGYVERTQETAVFAYCKLLERDKDALLKLKDFLTINVTEFFRDSVPYNLLKTQILPDLLKNSPNLNVLSAGCSNGAEPFSIAILLAELGADQPHRIVGVDIDETILAKARAGGPFPASEMKNVPPSLLTKYFVQRDGGYFVNEQIRNAVVFKPKNILTDALGTGYDLAMCRNVIIYFAPEPKAKLFGKLRDALKPSGVLWIGGTETVLDTEIAGLERIQNSFFQQKSSAKPVRSAVTVATAAAAAR